MTDPRQIASNWSGGVVGNGWYLPDLANVVPGLTQDSGSWSYGTPTPTPVFDPYADVGYGAGASAVTNQGTHAQAEHDYQGGVIGQKTGYDSSGNLISDPSNANFNPYSQAAILKRNYDNTTRGTTNSYASQGQLYAGSLLNAQNANTWNYNVGADQLIRGALSQYHSNDYGLTQSQDAGTAQLAALLGPAFTNFLNSQKGS